MTSPVDRRPVDEERWELRLRCGQCGFRRAASVSNAEAGRYERALNAQRLACRRRAVGRADRPTLPGAVAGHGGRRGERRCRRKVSDVGVNDDLLKQLGEKLPPGGAALIALGRSDAPDKVLQRLKQYGGEVIQTSLDTEREELLRSTLGEGVPA